MALTSTSKALNLLRGAGFCEGVASAMLIIFIPFHVRSTLEEPSLTVIALLLSLPALAVVPASNFWGAIADVTGKHGKITGLCFLGFTFGLILVPFLDSSLSVIAAVSILSLLYGSVRPLLLSQSTLLLEDEKPRALSTIFMFESLGFFCGGLLFGLVYRQDQTGAGALIFPAAGLCCLAASVATLYLPSIPNHQRTAPSSRARLLSLLGQDLRDVYKLKSIRKLLAVVLLASVSNFCFFGMYFAYFTEGIGGSGFLMSITLSASTVLAIPFFPLARRWVDRKGGGPVMKFAIGLWILNYTLLALTTSPYLAGLLFITPIYPFFLVSSNALAAEASQSQRRGGGLGALAGITAVSMALGSVLGGTTGDLLGPRSIPALSACLSAVAFLAFLLLYGSGKFSLKGIMR